MNEFMDMIKPQLDAMNEMYKNGYDAGYKAGMLFAYRDMRKGLDVIKPLTTEQEKQLDKMIEADIRSEREEKEIKECPECEHD